MHREVMCPSDWFQYRDKYVPIKGAEENWRVSQAWFQEPGACWKPQRSHPVSGS